MNNNIGKFTFYGKNDFLEIKPYFENIILGETNNINVIISRSFFKPYENYFFMVLIDKKTWTKKIAPVLEKYYYNTTVRNNLETLIMVELSIPNINYYNPKTDIFTKKFNDKIQILKEFDKTIDENFSKSELLTKFKDSKSFITLKNIQEDYFIINESSFNVLAALFEMKEILMKNLI